MFLVPVTATHDLSNFQVNLLIIFSFTSAVQLKMSTELLVFAIFVILFNRFHYFFFELNIEKCVI